MRKPEQRGQRRSRDGRGRTKRPLRRAADVARAASTDDLTTRPPAMPVRMPPRRIVRIKGRGTPGGGRGRAGMMKRAGGMMVKVIR